jgi:ankyrin repeat protein
MQDTPLHLAALGGYHETVQILIDQKANISSLGQV